LSRPFLPGAALTLFAAACSAPSEGSARVELNLPEQARELEGKRSTATTLHGDDAVTINLLSIKAPVAMHRHLKSEEVVYLLSGEGVLLLGAGERTLRAGDLVVVPRDTPHAFTPTGEGPAVLLQTFVPHFIEGDRVPEPERRPAPNPAPDSPPEPEPKAK
jgi:quercetin dioxygenase-like cupin family protein